LWGERVAIVSSAYLATFFKDKRETTREAKCANKKNNASS